jgi:Flp pilus assembly protein TadD
VALGYGRLQTWDWERSEAAFRRAVDLEPSSLTAHEWYGDMLFAAGRLPEAVEQNRQAARLDPSSAVIASESGAFLMMLRRFPEAIAEGHRALALDSLLPFPYVNLARVYLALGRPDSALALLERGRRPNEAKPQHWQVARALTLAATGRRHEALSIAGSIEADAERGRAFAFVAAMTRAGLGDRERAIRWLTRSVDARETEVANAGLACEPAFDPLRSDPRFRALLNRVGVRGCTSS